MNISIIIPVYKVELFLKRCINSVLSQSYQSWEMILVDDGSPDNCPNICDEYSSKDKRIKVIHKQNGGLSSARNAALDIITGEYVTFLDSDDYWHPEYLMILFNECINNNCDIVQSNLLRGKESVFPSINTSYDIEFYNNETIFTKFKSNIVICGKLFKSSLWNNIRMPEGKINEDDFTTWKLYFNANKIGIVNLPLYYYYINTNSITSNQKRNPRFDFIEAYNERLLFFKNKNKIILTNITRIHFCKSLSITYLYLTKLDGYREEKENLRNLYLYNYNKISSKKVIPIHVRIYFIIFKHSPLFLAKISNLIIRK